METADSAVVDACVLSASDPFNRPPTQPAHVGSHLTCPAPDTTTQLETHQQPSTANRGALALRVSHRKHNEGRDGLVQAVPGLD